MVASSDSHVLTDGAVRFTAINVGDPDGAIVGEADGKAVGDITRA